MTINWTSLITNIATAATTTAAVISTGTTNKEKIVLGCMSVLQFIASISTKKAATTVATTATTTSTSTTGS